MRTTLIFIGIAIDRPEDPTNHGPALRLQAARIAAFANAETRAPGRAPTSAPSVSANQFVTATMSGSSARNPDLGGLIPLVSYFSVGSGAGTVERSLLMARSTVRFISETTPRTFR